MVLVGLQERHRPRTGLHSLTPDNSMSVRRRGAHSSRVSRQRSSSVAAPPRVAQDVPLRVYPRGFGHTVGPLVVGERLAGRLPGVEALEGPMQDRRSGLLAQPAAAGCGSQPGERLHCAERCRVGADPVLHADRLAVVANHEVQPPEGGIDPRPAGPRWRASSATPGVGLSS